MAPFDQHPPSVRKRIALFCTAVIAAILLTIMYVRYTSTPTPDTTGSASKLRTFYTTIVEEGQSYFNRK